MEDVFGVLTGTFLTSLGFRLLNLTHAVTGGTAGVALLLSYVVPGGFGVLFFLVNIPFFLLAIRYKGWQFTIRSVISVALMSGWTYLHPHVLALTSIEPWYAVFTGNLLVGVGLLILFRHKASLGGFNILALILQEKAGWRAGYVQMALDVIVIASAIAVVGPFNAVRSALGAVLMSSVLAFNHRPGRYMGS